MTTREPEPLVWRRWAEADRLLAAALELPPADREVLVRRETETDGELRGLVLRLLENAVGDPDGVIGPSEDLVLAAFSSGGSGSGPHVFTAGDLVDRYRIVRQIGRGGMATVYEAERADGSYQQRVALKVMRRGLDTDDLIRRFMVERQILSSLSHPHIARLLDGGSTESGRPYLVMELVSGEPITRWSDNRSLDVRARLRLFLAVASAVSAAHRLLVVHRDIKPSNVLVDDDGTVKLLDFGIAKLLDRDEDLSLTGATALTPEYASPEQSAGAPITTSTDVYQLGILLRELLTGLPPRAVGTAEVDRTSLRPSRLTSREVADVATPAARAAARGTTTERLAKALRGDLDIIIGKATRPAAADRYASVDALAADVARYLDGHAILAHPESLGYQVRKFAGRHPVGVPSVMLGVVALLGFTVALSVQNRRVTRERDNARIASERAVATQEFLVDLFRTSDPTTTAATTQSPDITVGEALQRGRERVNRELADQPEVRAALLIAMGRTFTGLGRLETADTLLREAWLVLADVHGEHTVPVLPAILALADNHQKGREFRAADSLFHRAAAIRSALQPDTATAQLFTAMSSMRREMGDVDSAVVLAEKAVSLRRQLGDTIGNRFLGSLGGLAFALRGADRLDSAEAIYRTVIGLMERDTATSFSALSMHYNNLGFLLRTRQAYAGADSAYRAALAISERVLGTGHLSTLLVRQNLAGVLELSGRLEEAWTLRRAQIAAAEAEWPGGHWRVGVAYYGLGRSLLRNGRATDAVAPLESGVRSYANTLGSNHEWTVVARAYLGAAHLLAGRATLGRSMHTSAMSRLQARQDGGSPDGRSILGELAGILERENHRDLAQRIRELLGQPGG